jgi:ribosome-binding protein aMBF1 (putative translation factor)
MARDKPLTDADRAIGRRLREVRKKFRMSRADLAHWLACDAEVIKRIELGRVALKYDRAAVIIRQFQVDPVWLATGNGTIDGENQLPGNELQVDHLGRFSDVFEEKAAKVLSSALAAMPPADTSYGKSGADYQEADIRCAAIRSLTCELEEAIGDVPFDHLEDFERDLRNHIDQLMASFPAPTEVERAFGRALMRMAKRRHEAAQQAWRDKNSITSKQYVYNERSASIVADVPTAKIRHPWKTLAADLKRVLESERGMQAWLAQKLGVTPQAVNRWLSGDAAPNADLTLRLKSWIDRGATKTQEP